MKCWILFCILLVRKSGAFFMHSALRDDPSSWCLFAEKNHLQKDLKVIYDLENLTETQNMEIRKAGVHLTMAMRTMQVEHEAQLKSLKQQESKIQREHLYVRFAYQLMTKYVEDGNLHFKYVESKKEGDGDFEIAKSVAKNLDVDLWARCIAKYGFEMIDYQYDYRYGHHRVEFSFRLISTSAEEEDSQHNG